MSTSSFPLSSKRYVFDPRPRIPFLIVANRYWIGELCPDANDHDTFSKTHEDVRTLVFIHGNTGHKERWEPTIQRLFANQQANTGSSIRFHDMWSLDLPNHGDSAILNEDVLRWGYRLFSWDHHARGVHAFLAGLGTGVDVDFSGRRLSLVGHSMGVAVAMLAYAHYPLLEISSLHMIEPTLLHETGIAFFDNAYLSHHGNPRSSKLQDIWTSEEEAFEVLKTREQFCNWDERVLRLYVTHGHRPLPTAEHPDLKEGIIAKYTRNQQLASFRNYGYAGMAYRYLPHVLKEIPTHIVYGEICDQMPSEWQQETLHVGSWGISNFAGVITVPGAGHQIIQSHPDLVADIIWKQLGSRARVRMNETVLARL